ncbi:hypothetical protein HBA55_34495 [Pseudomaricurvus alkylphenolicus]|uniref:hypothetical protein n=1 Tax=Pseudomaricurvus alkylphenolicus TaxID=1306991 RepID=UPI0014210C59|nr:hypothetical protein [Pseudomaricurvus alkylphenolicus]NIB44741.1 hypothetical protein [Pseudomaricurvus alkylphenolicus]
MPAAKDGRKPVGTAHCTECDSEAAFYQVQKGKRAGYLYKRCGCGCDQSSGKAKQHRWLAEMTVTGDMLPHPLAEPKPAEPTPEPTEEPAPEPAPNPRPSKGLAGLLLLGLAGLAAVFMA